MTLLLTLDCLYVLEDVMNSSDGTIDTPPRSSRSATWIAVSIILLQILVSLILYPFLPPMVPSHWNAAGQIDGYMPKGVNALLAPAVSIAIYLFIRFIVGLGPRLGRQSQRANMNVVNLILVGELLLFLVIQLVIIATALHMAINFLFVLNIVLSVFFIFIGNYLGKLRRNFWAGIRTPWTLASDTVWERTHRLGSWLFVATGLLGLLMTFISSMHVWGMIGVLFIVTVILFVYSYVIFHNLEKSGVDPLSRPFDRQE